MMDEVKRMEEKNIGSVSESNVSDTVSDVVNNQR